MGVSIWEGNKAERVINALDSIALSMASNVVDDVTNWYSYRNLIRTGKIRLVNNSGDQIAVEKESGVYVTIVSTGVTAAAVDDELFIAAVNSAHTAAYEFKFDGAAWRLGEQVVELANYGITLTGTPAADDELVVHVQGTEIIFDILGIDKDPPANTEYAHSVTALTRDVLIYNAIAFSSAQALYSVSADVWPDGIPAGTTISITLDHGAYSGGTAQDGTYHTTLTNAVPVGGKIRHSAIGVYQSNVADYTVAKILAGTFTTYDANFNVIDSGLATEEGAAGTSLGTTTAADPQYKVGDHINFSQRNAYGTNRYAHSANRKWLNSHAAGAASGEIASWWTPSNEFDMPVRSTLPGFLHGLDAAFVACIGKVKKRTALCIADGYGYDDTEEYVWLPSMTEVGFGNNNNVVETAVGADGNPAFTGAYPFYVGATNADRIKVQAGTSTARYWWLRSPVPSFAGLVRVVFTSGALYYRVAYGTFGVVAGLCLI